MDKYINRDDALLHSEIIRVYSKDYGNIDVAPVDHIYPMNIVKIISQRIKR